MVPAGPGRLTAGEMTRDNGASIRNLRSPEPFAVATQLRVILGPPGTGKTERLLRRYRECLAPAGSAGQDPLLGRCLWLWPTWRAAFEIRCRMVAAGGYFRPGVTTFAQFAETLLDAAPEPIRPISGLMKRHLLGRLVGGPAR